MTQGYLVMAQGVKYARQAEHLARSISKTQTRIRNLSVITDCDVDSSVFDQVIRLDIDLKPTADWKIENRVQFYDLTPYDETVILDSDMLFLSDVSHWWKYLQNYELFLTNKVKTFRGDWAPVQNPYRRAFTAHNLPNVYSAFTYFKKTELTKNFFDLTKQIVLNWEVWIGRYTPHYIQKFPSIDLAMSIAVSVMGIEDEVTSNDNFPTFTHMKAQLQGWKHKTEKWEDLIGIYQSADEIKLGPYKQSGILHYVKKDFV